MITKNIVVKINNTDNFQNIEVGSRNSLLINLDSEDSNRMVKTTLFRDLIKLNFVLTNTTYDLMNFALAIYTIDQTVSRQINGFQGWSRYLKVNFPVNDILSWNEVKSDFENYLSFLSGDKWEFTFRQNQTLRTFDPNGNRNPLNITKVSLFSGGLDSFIGAIDLLSNNEKPFLVSHYKTSERKIQDLLIGKLKEHFGKNSFIAQKFWVQPNQHNVLAEKENTSRARSFLFITLGIVVANCLGDDIKMILPENGLISLNIPLTNTRLSSHSTRTTHPFFVMGLNNIFGKLNLNNKIINPYGFFTKGEMIVNCNERTFLDRYIGDTISCSHPENSRYQGRQPGLNCGYCVPCIIRQSAENRAGNIVTNYAIGDVRSVLPSKKSKRGSDLRAFKIGLERLNRLNGNSHSLALNIMRSGPIPYQDLMELQGYISVYQRGMEEVRQFLNQ